MKKKLSFYLILAVLVGMVSSCSNEDEIIPEEIPTKSLTVECNAINEKSLNTQSTSGVYFTLRLIVSDALTGEPVVGAIVQVKGDSKGAVTDREGNCMIVVKPGDILVVQYLGYKPTEYKVTVSILGRVSLEPV